MKCLKFSSLLHVFSRSQGRLIGFLIFAILIKDGVDIYGAKHLTDSAEVFPKPYDGTSSHYLPIIIHKLLIEDENLWILLNFLFILSILLYVGRKLAKFFGVKSGLIIFSIFLNSPTITILFQELGHYQTLFIVFSILYTIAQNHKLALILGILMISSAPEYSSISLILLWMWSRTFLNENYFKTIKLLLPISILLSVVNSVSLAQINSPSRLDAYYPNLEKSLISFIGAGHLGLYACWGSIWIVIISIISKTDFDKVKKRFLLPIFVIPLFFYATMADGTRIFVCLSSILLIPILIKFAENCSVFIKIEIALLFWLLPNIVSEIGSKYFKIPFEFFYSQNLDNLLGFFS